MVLMSNIVEAQSDDIGLNVGIVSIKNEPDLHMSDFSMGISYKFNQYIVKPRVDLEYVNISDYSGVTSLVKGSINGIYELSQGKFSPYL